MENERLQKILADLSGVDSRQFRIERLKGGGNNQAYRVTGQADDIRFLKLYHQDTQDHRRRGPTEYQWLNALWNGGVRNIPQPLFFAETSDYCAGLYGFLVGTPILSSDLRAKHVSAAVDFVTQINARRDLPQMQTLAPASEACFSLREHWATVQKRIDRLDQINPKEGSMFGAAAALVQEHIRPAWQRFSKLSLSDFDRVLPLVERILSPSDFGFHNALQTTDGTCFFDFEYAGWDDPAKLICDFFNQVSVPVPFEFYSVMLKGVSSLLPNPDLLEHRVNRLLPLYQLKWACILLNHFLPSDARRKKFALQNEGEWETLLANQIQKATALLETLEAQFKE